jgi:hypothetical protein
MEPHRRREILKVLVDQVTVERRAKPSEGIWSDVAGGRVSITLAQEDNVIELAQRPDMTKRYSTVSKVAS